MQSNEQIINEVKDDMAIEGFTLTNDDVERMRICFADRSKLKPIIKELVKKHFVLN